MGQGCGYCCGLSEFDERDDTLGDTVDVDGVCGVVIVFWSSVFPEKVSCVEGQTTADEFVKIRRLTIISDTLQSDEVIPRVEVVDPLLGRRLAVIPSAVLMLLSNRETRGVEGRLEEFPFSREPANAA